VGLETSSFGTSTPSGCIHAHPRRCATALAASNPVCNSGRREGQSDVPVRGVARMEERMDKG
jgi:hypothetical protein